MIMVAEMRIHEKRKKERETKERVDVEEWHSEMGTLGWRSWWQNQMAVSDKTWCSGESSSIMDGRWEWWEINVRYVFWDIAMVGNHTHKTWWLQTRLTTITAEEKNLLLLQYSQRQWNASKKIVSINMLKHQCGVSFNLIQDLQGNRGFIKWMTCSWQFPCEQL